MRSLSTPLVASLALSLAAQGALAQDPSPASSVPSTGSTSAQLAQSSARANSTAAATELQSRIDRTEALETRPDGASRTGTLPDGVFVLVFLDIGRIPIRPSASSAAATAASSSASNPLIPAAASAKCQAFLTSLNADTALASCTAPLLSALSAFLPSPSLTSYDAVASSVSGTVSSFCAASTSDDSTCSDAALRALLSQFSGNCTAELQAKNDAVLGAYDALYVLSPLRTAVCATDAAGGYCIEDIAKQSMPVGSTGANATAVVSSDLASDSSAAAVATGAGSNSSTGGGLNTSSSIVVTPADESAKFVSLAASSAKYSFDVPAPPSLYVQITSSVRRLLRRQQYGDDGSNGSNGGSGSSSQAWSSNAASASASASGNGTVSAAVSANSTAAAVATGASNSTSSATPGAKASSNASPFQNYTLPSVLPSATTFSSSALPFLLLTPNLTSSVLCSSCTKSILATYVAWESRMPYALGLANSPMLGGQGALWTQVGGTCGEGFLEATAKQAGQENLTGGAASLAGRVGAVMALAVAVAAVLA
ncbi:hypothetical protein JCM8097_007728 [Rhodosporidiobolus ruineniae]